jgi:hypothetical protein
MANEVITTAPVITLPTDFQIRPVEAVTKLGPPPPPPPPPSLGPLAAFTGTFNGSGFNTIFRPDSTKTPTSFPVPPTDGVTDNVLELNLTSETLSFSGSLGSVPNRGTGTQPDIFLNGIPYLQAISDISTGPIHLEPGLWVIVPTTTIPKEGITLARMASIPHGTTFVAQGTSAVVSGAPTIPKVDITPFFTVGGGKVSFKSQTVADQTTHRIPQNIPPGSPITQAILTDPNTFIRKHIVGQNITSTTVISIATQPPSPLFGDGDPITSTSDGGSANIAFLLGDNNTPPKQPNAQNLRMTATFWVETVKAAVTVPALKPGGSVSIKVTPTAPGQPVPTVHVTSKAGTTAPKTITVTYTQIQYSQEVFLNFNTLTWPHVSVATLVPASPIAVEI